MNGCNWTSDDMECKYRFDSHCTLPIDIISYPNDSYCSMEIKNDYRKYVNGKIKELKRDCR